MPQIFFPSTFTMVDASSHGDGYQYKVAVGHEAWDGGMVLVGKVQIVDDKGKIQGRQAPSYPSQEEYLAVHKAMMELLELLPKKAPVRSKGPSGQVLSGAKKARK